MVTRFAAAVALGLLMVSGTTAQQAQLIQGRADLLEASSSQAAHLSLVQLFGLFRRTQVSVLADSYANVFLLTAAVTAIAVVGALFLRSGPATHAGSEAAVSIE